MQAGSRQARICRPASDSPTTLRGDRAASCLPQPSTTRMPEADQVEVTYPQPCGGRSCRAVAKSGCAAETSWTEFERTTAIVVPSGLQDGLQGGLPGLSEAARTVAPVARLRTASTLGNHCTRPPGFAWKRTGEDGCRSGPHGCGSDAGYVR